MEKKIVNFFGFSGASVELLETPNGIVVRKKGNIKRNIKKMIDFKKNGYLVPDILSFTDNEMNMQYIDGIDMKTFLLTHDVNLFIDYLKELINKFKCSSKEKNYYEVYIKQLQWVDDDKFLPFKKNQLIEKLPKILPRSICHGDLTLENLIYSKNQFFMIDVSDGDYDSWVFDIAKLRQDLDGEWFLRNSNTRIPIQLITIKQQLIKDFSLAFDDMLYILMLLRVYKYCITNTIEHTLILKEIKRLWK